jgi:hypothetical protein
MIETAIIVGIAVIVSLELVHLLLVLWRRPVVVDLCDLARAIDQAEDAQDQCAVSEGRMTALYDLVRAQQRRLAALEKRVEAAAAGRQSDG